MIDELEYLETAPPLLKLLQHYADQANPDREAWQERVMELGEIPREGLVKLHGELLAWDWLEQDTGAARACYRITPAGQRTLKRVATRDEPLAA
jgi:hypothetical protein